MRKLMMVLMLVVMGYCVPSPLPDTLWGNYYNVSYLFYTNLKDNNGIFVEGSWTFDGNPCGIVYPPSPPLVPSILLVYAHQQGDFTFFNVKVPSTYSSSGSDHILIWTANVFSPELHTTTYKWTMCFRAKGTKPTPAIETHIVNKSNSISYTRRYDILGRRISNNNTSTRIITKKCIQIQMR